MHYKAFLIMGYMPKAWRQFKMMFKPAIGKVNYTQAKAYGKMNQKFVTRNVNDEIMGHVP
jgi:flagellar hook-basal body complex protein FliE